MQRRTKFLILGLVVVAALPLALFWFGADSQRGQRALPAEPTSTLPTARAELQSSTLEDESGAGREFGASARVATTGLEGGVTESTPDARQGPRIRGLVHGEDSIPFPDELVLAFDVSGSPKRAPIARTQTDDAGIFEFPRLEEKVLIVVQPVACMPRWLRVAPDEFATIKVFDSFPLRGVVLDEANDRPLANVEVRSSGRSYTNGELLEVQSARTDEEGLFEIPIARVGRNLELTLQWDDLVPAQRTVPVRTANEAVTLYLGKARPVPLRTVDLDTAAPLPGVRVLIDGGLAGETDENGRLSFTEDSESAQAERKITAQLDGGVITMTAWTAEQRRSGVELEIPMIGGASVHGVVVDQQQQPVEGASVRLGGSRQPARSSDREDIQFADGQSRVRTNALGQFELTGVVPRKRPIVVVVRLNGYEQTVSAAINVGTAGVEATVRIVLTRGAQVHGVVTLDGEPLSTTVRWKAKKSAGSTSSNDYGEYELRGVPSGDVQLLVEHPGRRGKNDRYLAKRDVSLVAGETYEVNIHCTRDTGVIAGVVTLTDGTPLGGKRVTASSETERNTRVSVRAETNAEGEFELEVPLELGLTYRVNADLGTVRATAREVAPGTTDLALTFEEQGELWLTITDLFTGTPIDGASVKWRASNATEDTRWKNYQDRGNALLHGAGGRITLALPLGRVDLMISLREKGYTPVLVANLEVQREPRGAHAVRLETGTRLELQFVDGKGEPLARGNRSRRRRWSLEWSGSPDSSAAALPRWARRVGFKIPSDGRVVLVGVPPGSARFTVSGNNKPETRPRRFEITPTGTQQLTVRIGR